jgi:hypothetical protein
MHPRTYDAVGIKTIAGGRKRSRAWAKLVSFCAVFTLIAACYTPMQAVADGDVEITGVGLSPSVFGAAYSPSSSTDLIVHGYVDTGESPSSGRQICVTLQNAVNLYRQGNYFSTDISKVSLPSFLESPAARIDGSDVIVTMDVKRITGNATGSLSVTFSYAAAFRGWVANGEKMADVTVASMNVTDPDDPVTLSSKCDSVTAQVGSYGWADISKSDGNATIVPPDSTRALNLRLWGTGPSGSANGMNRYFVPGTAFKAVLTFPPGADVTGYGSGVLDNTAGTVTWTIPVGADGLPEGHTASSYLWSDNNVKISFPEVFLKQTVALSLTGYGQLVGNDASSNYATSAFSFPVDRAIHMAPVVFRGFANCNVLIDEPGTESLGYDGISELRNAGTLPVPGVKVTYDNDADGAGRKGKVSKIAFAQAAAAYKIKMLTHIYKYDETKGEIYRSTVETRVNQPTGAAVSVNMEEKVSLGAGEYIDSIELYPLSAASTPGYETNELPVGVNFGVGVYYKSWGNDADPASRVFPNGTAIQPDSYTKSRFTASWEGDYNPPAGAIKDDSGVCTSAIGPSNSVRYNWNAYNPIGIFTLNTTGARVPGEILTGTITFGNSSRGSNTYGSANWNNPEIYFTPPPNVIFDPSQTLYVTGNPEPLDIRLVKTVNGKPVYRLRLPSMSLFPNGSGQTIRGISMTIKPGSAQVTNQQIVYPYDPYASGNGGLLLTSRDATEVSGRFTAPSTAYGYPTADAEYDIDGNAHTTRMLAAANSGTFTIPETTEMLAYATLKNNETGEWKPAQDVDAETTVALLGTGQYKLTILNKGNTWMGEVRLLDILPREGDSQVLSPYGARGSEWRATLESVSMQIFDEDHEPSPNHQTPQIRYSTQNDPDYRFNGGVQRSGRPDGTFVGDADISEAQSFDLAMSERIPPGYSVEILVTVKAPIEGVTGQVAYNSFVATANFYETNSSQSVKTATTFEPSKQKFILYLPDESAPPDDDEGGGESEEHGDGESGESEGGESVENSGSKSDGGTVSENIVVESVVAVASVENVVVENGGETASVENSVVKTVNSGAGRRSDKSGNHAEATISSPPRQSVTTSAVTTPPAVTSPPTIASPPAASVGPDESDDEVIDDDRTFSEEHIEQFKLKGDDMSTIFKGLTIDDEVMLRAQSGNVIVDLTDGNVPTGNFVVKSVWSLLSLILSLIAVVISVLMIVGAAFMRGRRESGEYALNEYAAYQNDDESIASEDEDEKERKRGKTARTLTIIFGALTLTVWRILDNLSQPMAWMNQGTRIVIILFAIQIACIVIYQASRAGKNREFNDAD